MSVGELTKNWAKSKNLVCFHSREIDSTNLAAKAYGYDPTLSSLLFVSDHQTGGRGRGTHAWHDQGHGQTFLASWVYYRPYKFQHTTAQLCGLALFTAARKAYPHLPWSLKAPNDLYLGRRKIAGLLLDIVTGGPAEQLIVGLGLNVLSHPPDVPTATHLAEHEPAAVEAWPKFLDSLQDEFEWAVGQAREAHLSDMIQVRLLDALNRFPLLVEPYARVDSEGNLLTPTQHIRWTEL